MSDTPVVDLFYEGWAYHQRLVLDAIGHLGQEQLALRTAPDEMAIWQIASHMAGSRAYWFHDILGEGDAAVRDMFRVATTTVSGLPLDDAGWEDDETQPRSAAEIVEGFHATWGLIEGCLQRWTPDDLTVKLPQGSSGRLTTRGWVIWHLMEHDAHHAGAISLVLGTNGLPGLDL